MTRAEFIQQGWLKLIDEAQIEQRDDGSIELIDTYATSLDKVVAMADKLEASGKAMWSDPTESALLKRIEDEAHRRGYLLGVEDGRKYAMEEARENRDEEIEANNALCDHASEAMEVGYKAGLTAAIPALDAFLAVETAARSPTLHDLVTALARLDVLRKSGSRL